MTEAELNKIVSNLKTIILKPMYFNGLSIELLDVLRARHSYGRVINAHHHPWFEFNYFEKGDFFTFINEEKICSENKKSILIPPGITHSHTAGKNPDDGICIRWQITPVNSEFANEQSLDFVKCLHQMQTSCFDVDMSILLNLRNDVFFNQSVFLNWLVSIYDKRRTTVFTRKKQNSISAQAILYMQEYCHLKISAVDIANALNISYRNIARIFKEETGITIIEKLNEIRINKAKSLLLESDLSISKIAENVGFENVYYFSNKFKKYEHVSPAKFRKNKRDE